MNYEELTTALINEGLDPRSYSGRGMFGKECVGVEVVYPGDYTLPKGYRMDNMGRDYIVYWPSVKWEGDDDYEEDEE